MPLSSVLDGGPKKKHVNSNLYDSINCEIPMLHNPAAVQLDGAQTPRRKWPARSQKSTFFANVLIMHTADCATRKTGRKDFA